METEFKELDNLKWLNDLHKQLLDMNKELEGIAKGLEKKED
jgi:hypothetical protein